MELRLNGFPPPLLCIRTRQPNRPPPRNFFSPPPPFRSCVRVCFGERREKKSFVEWRRLHFCQHCLVSRAEFTAIREMLPKGEIRRIFSLSQRASLRYIPRVPRLPWSSSCMGMPPAVRPPARPSSPLLQGFVTRLCGFPILPAWLSVLLMYLLLLWGRHRTYGSARLLHRYYTCTTTRRRRRRRHTDGRAQWADSSPLGIFFLKWGEKEEGRGRGNGVAEYIRRSKRRRRE